MEIIRDELAGDRGAAVLGARPLPALDGATVGGSLAEIATPVLVVHRDGLERNLARMAERTAGPVRLRPHFKTHKTVEIARLQLAAGAIGITAATIWEAHALARAGIPDVLIANEVIGAAKLRRAAEVAGMCRLTVAVDGAAGARQLADAVLAAGERVSVVIEVDVGMGRCGVREPAEALALAGLVDALDGLELVGVMGYEGHCVLDPDGAARTAAARASADALVDAAELLRAAGHRVDVVSAGGTGTAAVTGVDPRITDIQAGSYVFMDSAYERVVDDFPVALTVLATVLSRHGRTAVLDCGVKTVAATLGTPRLAAGEGTVRYVAEEHTVVDLADGAELEVGARVHVVTGHCCETVNLHDRLVVADGEQIVDIWPVQGRGPGGAWQ